MEEAFPLMEEGMGRGVHHRHALRVAPAGQPWMETMGALASVTDSWSQNLGNGLFLLIERFVQRWSDRYFSESSPPPSPLAVLAAAIDGPAPR